MSYLEMFNVNGVYVDMQTPDTEFAAADGLLELFRATEFFADPADWR